MSAANKVELSDLTSQVAFLDTYGFQITSEYVQMLLEQIRLRDQKIDEIDETYRREMNKREHS